MNPPMPLPVLPGGPEWLAGQVQALAFTLAQYITFMMPFILILWGLLFGIDIAKSLISKIAANKGG